jgi:hypothetical protein
MDAVAMERSLRSLRQVSRKASVICCCQRSTVSRKPGSSFFGSAAAARGSAPRETALRTARQMHSRFIVKPLLVR